MNRPTFPLVESSFSSTHSRSEYAFSVGCAVFEYFKVKLTIDLKF